MIANGFIYKNNIAVTVRVLIVSVELECETFCCFSRSLRMRSSPSGLSRVTAVRAQLPPAVPSAPPVSPPGRTLTSPTTATPSSQMGRRSCEYLIWRDMSYQNLICRDMTYQNLICRDMSYQNLIYRDMSYQNN